jgi:hypothetical protein
MALVVSTVLAALLALAVSPSLAFAADGYVTVNDDTTHYASMDEAAASAVAVSGTITYHVSGHVTCAFTTDLACSGAATTVKVVGSNNTAQVDLNGEGSGSFTAKGAQLDFTDVTLDDRRTNCSGYWLSSYLMFDCAGVDFTGCTFDEGVLIAGGITANFDDCTFSELINTANNDNSVEHYQLWVHHAGTVNVKGCTFEKDSFGSIKDTTYTESDPTTADIKISVTNSTFTDIGHHRIMHLEGATSLTLSNNHCLDCFNVTGDKRFIDCGGTTADDINADYFADDAMDNVVEYTLNYTVPATGATEKTTYQFHTTSAITDHSLGGTTYKLANGYDVWTSAAITGTDATQISDVAAGPRNYDLVEGVANTYYIDFDANGGDGSMDAMTMTYGVPASLTANTFTRDGYTFLGWSHDADATSPDYEDGATVQDLTNEPYLTMVLYAVWSKDEQPVSPDTPSAPDTPATPDVVESSATSSSDQGDALPTTNDPIDLAVAAFAAVLATVCFAGATRLWKSNR